MDMISRSYTMPLIKRGARFLKIKLTKEVAKVLKPKNFLTVSAFKDLTLLDLMRECNQYVGFQLHISESKSAMGGSDFAPFGYFKIPWLSYHAAFTKDYHQPTDSVNKVDYKFMGKLLKLVWLSAYKVANR